MVMGRSIPLRLATSALAEEGALLMTRETDNPADLHRPVMVEEIIDALSEVPAGTVVDATVGLGGHSEAILEAREDVRVIGLDRDSDTLELTDLRLGRYNGRYELCHTDFRRLPELAAVRGWAPLSAVILDLGVSSLQLDSAERGFSFLREGPLDMRMDRTQERTAATLVNRLPRVELESLIRDYGEERYAGRIARAIVEARDAEPIATTTQLAGIVESTVPGQGPRRIHPATRTFQALRIAVNRELDGLYDFVIAAARLLAPGGRLAAVAFHSLEDRQVKRAATYLASDCECPPRLPQCVCDKEPEVSVVTPRPLRPDDTEVQTNPRARSARLRILERI